MISYMDEDLPRPKQHLIAAGHLYPGAWKAVDKMRADRGKDLPAWPPWCYLPMAGFYAIVSEGRDRVPPRLIFDVARLTALGTWRISQGIYRFDPTLQEALARTSLKGDLPCEALHRLPEWCVYIETPGMTLFGDEMYGFWAHLEWDANTGREELRLLLDTKAALLPVPIHLGGWPLQEAIERVIESSRAEIEKAGIAMPPGTKPSFLVREELEPLISLLLYLCSEELDIENYNPRRPLAVKTRKGFRTFQSDQVRVWDVGVRMGSALRRALQEQPEDDEQEPGEAGSRGPQRPHIRAAHWHSFWTGPRKPGKSGERKLIVRWLPPIPVNLKTPDDLPVTIRPVV